MTRTPVRTAEHVPVPPRRGNANAFDLEGLERMVENALSSPRADKALWAIGERFVRGRTRKVRKRG